MRTRSIIAIVLLAGCGSTTATTGGGGYGKSASTTSAPAATSATTANDAAAAYGKAYGGSYGAATTAAPSTSAAKLTIIKTALGSAVGDAAGFALYMFTPDSGGKPTCVDTCAANWPPAATTGAPTAAAGLDATKLSTVKHPNGKTQVTYNGHPLYRYGGDAAAGDTGGQGRLGYWYLVSPAGAKITG